MNSIKEVYLALKQFDKENRLFLNESEDMIELKVDGGRSVMASDDYYTIIVKGKEWTHTHLDCDEIYEELLEVLQEKNVFSADSQIRAYIRKEKIWNIVIIAFGIIMICVAIIYEGR